MEIIKIAAAALIAATLSLIVRQHKPEYSFFILIASGVLIYTLVLDNLIALINFITSMQSKMGTVGDFLPLVLKASGSALIISIASDICKDSGENALASKIETAGKFVLLSMALPLLRDVVTIITGNNFQ